MSAPRLTLAAGVLAAATAYAQPAHALFGPVCIPTIHNCMCTYMMPCPVTDPARLAKEFSETLNMEAQEELMKLIQEPKQQFLKALRGVTGNIPGLDSIGLDLGGLLSGDLSALGLPSFPTDIAEQINSLGIDGKMIAKLAKGELKPADFIGMAGDFGIDTSMLSEVGLDIGTIQALAEGDLGASEIFGIAEKMGFQAGVLHDIGIDVDLIEGIAAGDISPDRILRIAENAGLDMSALASVGLDLSTIEALPEMAKNEVMGVLQKAGFGSDMLDGLGLDAAMIGRIASGELPAASIADLVAGTGIDPTAITIPSIHGPISLDGLRMDDRFDDITIPVSSIPGLEGLLGSGSSGGLLGGSEATGGSLGGDFAGILGGGDGSSGDLFSGGASETAAMCSTDRSLVSVGEPPNPFGSDVENIDMAISGGYIETFPEVVNDTLWAVRDTAIFAAARAIQVRPLLPKALEAIDTFEEMMKETKTLQDDIIVNDTIHGQLMTAKAEKTSLLASYTSIMAAREMTPRTLDPVPTFLNDSRFQDVVRSTVKEKPRRASIAASSLSKASGEYGTFQRYARESILHHNLYRDARTIEAGLPATISIIDDHETYKQFLVDLEEILKAHLVDLYVDPEAAWEIMQPQLYSGVGEYLDGSKWREGLEKAISISLAATAQVPTTIYGTRIKVGTISDMDRGGSSIVLYSTTSESLYGYPGIDSYAAAESDPYRVLGAGDSVSLDTVSTATGPVSTGTELVGVLQYYFETYRRVLWKGETRRGPGELAMTGALWNEMVTYAPECLSGPLEMTEDNIASRPELFDLDKACEHLVWEGADPGDYIDAGYLGGADAALWLSKITMDQVEERTGGPDLIRENLQASLDYIRGTDAVMVLEMQGHSSTVDHIDTTIEALETALADTEFSKRIDFPRE